MTEIHIKGLLGKKFGSFFKINVTNAFNALKALDTIRSGFLTEIYELNKKNYNYFILLNGCLLNSKDEFLEKKKIKSIEIVPAIIGSGAVVVAALGLTGVAAVAVSFIVNLIVQAVISLGVSFLMNKLNKEASPPEQKKLATGGATAAIESAGRSYVFSNKVNVASQGSSIPVGYGKLKTSSQVLLASVKNYPTSINNTIEFKSLENTSLFLDFLTD